MKPNFIITNACNLNCPYCFANESRIDERKDQENMSLEQFKTYVDKFCKEDKKVVFCGGEPTRHPEFIEMFEFVLKEKNYNIVLLTNGVWSDPVYNYFKNFYSDMTNLPLFSKISMLFNIPEYVFKSDKTKIKRVKDILSFIPGKSKNLSLTFYKPEFDGRYIIELAKESGVTSCRQSFAAPYINDNKSIDFVYDYRQYASSLARFIKEGNQAGISKISADCGYIPYCAFTREEMSDILSSGNSLIALCSHEGPVDIAKEISWRCYGLFGLESKKNSSDDDRDSLDSYWMRTAQLLYNFSIFKNCETCFYWHNNTCRGGCHATKAKYIIQNYSKELLYPFENDNLLSCIPVKSNWCSLYKNPSGKTIVITAYINKKVKIVDVKYKYTFELLEICDGVTDLKTIAGDLSARYENQGLTFSHVVEHVKRLYSMRVLELIPAYLDNQINKIELEQTHQRLFFDVKGKIPCYITDHAGKKINGVLLKLSEEFASIFVDSEIERLPDECFLYYDTGKIGVKILSKEVKSFKLKKGKVLDLVFQGRDKNSIDNFMSYTDRFFNNIEVNNQIAI